MLSNNNALKGAVDTTGHFIQIFETAKINHIQEILAITDFVTVCKLVIVIL